MLTPATRSRTWLCTCSGVAWPELVHRLQDQLALRGEPQAALPEHFGKGCGGHVTSIVRSAATLRLVAVVIPGSGTPQPDDYGDGVFETAAPARRTARGCCDEHLDRLARSAALLDLPLPPRHSLISPDRRGGGDPAAGEGALRLICRRDLTYYATVAAVPGPRGASAGTASALSPPTLGVSMRRPPWSLSGAKTTVVRREPGRPALGGRAGRRRHALVLGRGVRPGGADRKPGLAGR